MKDLTAPDFLCHPPLGRFMDLRSNMPTPLGKSSWSASQLLLNERLAPYSITFLFPGRFWIFSFLHATRWKNSSKESLWQSTHFHKISHTKVFLLAVINLSIREQKTFCSRSESILLARIIFIAWLYFVKTAFSDTNDNSTRPYVKVIIKLPPCKNVIA